MTSVETVIPMIDLGYALDHLSGEKMNFSEFVDDISYVPLETNDLSLMGPSRMSSINITKNYIFTADGKLFRKDGHFVRQLGKIGQGPGEYILALDRAMDEEREEVYVYDNATRNIYIYGFDNQFKKRVQVSRNGNFIVSIGSGKILLFRGYYGYFDNFFEYKVIDVNNGEVLYTRNSGITDDMIFRTTMNLGWHYNGETFYYEASTDSVFKLDENGEIDTPRYFINLGKYKNPDSENFTKIGQIVESNQFIFFSISEGRQNLHYAAYDKQTGKIRINKFDEFFNNDIDGGFLWLFRGTQDDKLGFGCVFPYLAKERIEMLSEKNKGYDREKNQKLRRLIHQVKEDDNEIYYFFHLK